MLGKKTLLTIIISLTVIALSAIAATRYFLQTGGTNAEMIVPSAKEEYNKLAEHLAAKDTAIYIDGTIQLYDAAVPDKINESISFFYQKNGVSLFAKMGGLLTISNGDLILQLDTINKYILLGRLTDSTKQSLKTTILPFDQFLGDTSVFKASTAITPAGKQRILTLKNEHIPEVKECRIIYDTTTYAIQSCEIEWWKYPSSSISSDGRTQVLVTRTNYSYHSPVKLYPEDAIKRYILIKNDTLQPTDAYSNYHIYASY